MNHLFHGKALDNRSPIPLYFQLKEIILAEIKNGNLKTGDVIPTEKSLQEIFGVSRITIRQAITSLVHDGYLFRVKAKGTFVAKPKLNQAFMQELESFNVQMKRLGLRPSTKVLDLKEDTAGEEVAAQLNVKTGTRIIEFSRLRFADLEPIVLVKTYLPYQQCRFLLDHNMEEESLYQVLAVNQETKICRVVRTVEANLAGEYEAMLLGIAKGDPIQFISFIGYNQMNQPIEYSQSSYRGDRNKFTVEVYLK